MSLLLRSRTRPGHHGRRGRGLAWFAGLAVAAGCSPGPTVLVVNQSATTLSNVVVQGPRFTNALGDIPPGGEARVVIQPGGDSSLRLRFDAAGRQQDSGELGYVEANRRYRASFVVATNLAVRLDTHIRTF